MACCASRPKGSARRRTQAERVQYEGNGAVPHPNNGFASKRPKAKGETSDEDEGYFSAEEDFPGSPQTWRESQVSSAGGRADYGCGQAGEIVIGGRWVASESIGPYPSEFVPTLAVGWNQPDLKETEPLTEQEARDMGEIADAVGRERYSTVPADLQLAFVRDIFGKPDGVDWDDSNKFDNIVELISSCARWRQEIDAECLINDTLPKEDLFNEIAQSSHTGTDSWGHPRIWAEVTTWPPANQQVRDNFTAEEVMRLHCKRFLRFNESKRYLAVQKKRPAASPHKSARACV